MPEVVAEKTPEQIETEAQAEDIKKAIEEDKASKEKMKGAQGPFTNIRRHLGVGPLIVKTIRGEIKAFARDLIVTFTESVTPEQRELKEEEMVFSEAQFLALVPGVAPKDLPNSLEERALRIGEERRKAVKPPVATTAPATTTTTSAPRPA
jgi:hypothetical protein